MFGGNNLERGSGSVGSGGGWVNTGCSCKLVDGFKGYGKHSRDLRVWGDYKACVQIKRTLRE
jgi:hypothetical protein